MKFSKTDPQTRESRVAYIKERWTQLSRLVEDTQLRALKYLLLTNSGGAIAVLSFMGSSESTRTQTGPMYALGFFISGIILTGILVARGVHTMEGLMKHWRKNVAKYYIDEIGWKELVEIDENRVPSPLWDYILGYGAFLCFIVGSFEGLSDLLFKK